jgi:hypothetical protein
MLMVTDFVILLKILFGSLRLEKKYEKFSAFGFYYVRSVTAVNMRKSLTLRISSEQTTEHLNGVVVSNADC